MAKRTGLVTLIFLLERICRFIVRYRQSILDATNNHGGLSDLFDTIIDACAEVVAILEIYRELGT